MSLFMHNHPALLRKFLEQLGDRTIYLETSFGEKNGRTPIQQYGSPDTRPIGEVDFTFSSSLEPFPLDCLMGLKSADAAEADEIRSLGDECHNNKATHGSCSQIAEPTCSPSHPEPDMEDQGARYPPLFAQIPSGLSFSSKHFGVLTFNILASVWASPSYYPPNMDPAVLDPFFRRERVLAVLRENMELADVICLQEVTLVEYEYFAEQFEGLGLLGFFTPHDPEYWSHDLDEDIPWAPNGNAIFMKEHMFEKPEFFEIGLSSSGNRAPVIISKHKESGRVVRLACVHLDSEYSNRRERELLSLLKQFNEQSFHPKYEEAGLLDIIAGDMNSDTLTGHLKRPLQESRFVDVLGHLGVRDDTHPITSEPHTIIDHVLIRSSFASPVFGEVLFSSMLSLYPKEEECIEHSMRLCGSDHYPVLAIIGQP